MPVLRVASPVSAQPAVLATIGHHPTATRIRGLPAQGRRHTAKASARGASFLP